MSLKLHIGTLTTSGLSILNWHRIPIAITISVISSKSDILRKRYGFNLLCIHKVYDECINDFEDTDCYWNDACNGASNYYYDCSGEMFADGAENDCTADFFCNQVLR